MELIYHGAMCCGMRSIHSLPMQPAAKVGRLKDGIPPGGVGNHKSLRTFYEDAEEETGVQRLDRLLAFIDRTQHGNMVEVVVANMGSATRAQATNWKATLISRGFVEVNSWKNSNTANTCISYHRIAFNGKCTKQVETGEFVPSRHDIGREETKKRYTSPFGSTPLSAMMGTHV